MARRSKNRKGDADRLPETAATHRPVQDVQAMISAVSALTSDWPAHDTPGWRAHDTRLVLNAFATRSVADVSTLAQALRATGNHLADRLLKSAGRARHSRTAAPPR